MNKNLDSEQITQLYKAILTLQTEQECSDFFEDLCTVVELKAMSQRLMVAKLLSEGKVYTDIVEHTKASTATISRVNRALLYGNGSYVSALKKIK